MGHRLLKLANQCDKAETKKPDKDRNLKVANKVFAETIAEEIPFSMVGCPWALGPYMLQVSSKLIEWFLICG